MERKQVLDSQEETELLGELIEVIVKKFEQQFFLRNPGQKLSSPSSLLHLSTLTEEISIVILGKASFFPAQEHPPHGTSIGSARRTPHSGSKKGQPKFLVEFGADGRKIIIIPTSKRPLNQVLLRQQIFRTTPIDEIRSLISSIKESSVLCPEI